MTFQKLCKVILEAKDTKPGERFFTAQNSAGPAGISSSPIGKSNFNPLIEPRESKDPVDKGANAISTIKLLGKAFQVLKNDEVFTDQMRGIMNGFKKNRGQISAYQESVIKTKPKVIDNLWGQINRLIKIVNDPKKREEGGEDYDKFLAELEKVKATKDDHKKELDDVYAEIENVVGENEELNDQYLDQLLTVINHTANRLYKIQANQLQVDKEAPKTSIPLHELDYEKLQAQVNKDAEAQLQLLELLASEDDSINPLLIFLKLQDERYKEAKDRSFQLKNGDNYSITVDQLYNNLPLFALINYFSHTILRSPEIKLSKVQQKRANSSSSDGGGMLDRLSNVKTEAQFENLRPELIDYLNGLTVSNKDTLLNMAKGPFNTRKGSANAAVKIRSSLKASNINEDFNKIATNLLKSYRFDEDSFKIDLIEVLY